MNSTYLSKAEYKEQEIKEYQGNPLIEALEPIKSPADVIKLSYYPKYDESERYSERHIRLHMLQKIFFVFQILPHHIDLESRISRIIRQSYLAKNPLSKHVRKEYEKRNTALKTKELDFMRTEYYSSTANGFGIIGISGIGKTTSLYKVLPKKQIIIHSKYKKTPLNCIQLVWLKIECPYDGSVSSLTKNFFKSIDDLLGTDYQKKYCNGRFSTSTRIPAMAIVASNINLGMLIIDEIQFLKGVRSKSRLVLQFLTTLVNEIGIPIILVSTPSGAGLLQRDFKTARRMSGQGDMVLNRLKNDKEWNLFIKAIWKYQWIRNKIELTTELSNTLYEECQGIIDIAVKLYAMTQVYAINTANETLNSAMIRKVSRDNFKLIQPMLTALKSGNPKRIAEYEDVSTVNIDIQNIIKDRIEIGEFEKRIQDLTVAQQKEKFLNQIAQKEEVSIKLKSIGKCTKKALKLVDKYVIDKSLTTNDIVIRILEELSKTQNVIKYKTLDQLDVRNIVLKGREESKSNYESLLESNLIGKLTMKEGRYYI